jgi:hypothetical protein
MAKNLMGFKRVDGIPNGISHRKGQSIYAPLLNEVNQHGGTYALDTKDNRRAKYLTNTLRIAAKNLGIDNVRVVLRDTIVYVERRQDA